MASFPSFSQKRFFSSRNIDRVISQGAPLVHKIVSFVFCLFPRSHQMSPTFVDKLKIFLKRHYLQTMIIMFISNLHVGHPGTFITIK